MSTTTAIRVPAGWYPDPVELGTIGTATQRRWWDGLAWTHHTAPLHTPVSPDISAETVAKVTAATQARDAAQASTRAAAPQPAPVQSPVFAVVSSAPATLSPRESARAAENMSLHPVDPGAGLRAPATASRPTTVSASSPANAGASDYEPFRNRAHEEAKRSVRASADARNPHGMRVHTVSVWLMATMPITQALLVFWVFSTLPAESSAWTRALAVAFPFVLTAALAAQDTRLLELSGHLRTAPWVAALFAPPVYLAVRGVRVTRATGASPWPLLVWMASQVSVVVVWSALDPEGAQALLRTMI